MQKQLLASALALVACSAIAESTQQAGPYLYPHVTSYNYDQLLNLNPETDEGVGLGIGYQFENNWAIEFSYDLINTETSVGTETDTKVWELNSVYRFTSDSNWQPIFIGGIGHIQNTFYSAPTFEAEATTVNVGGGIEYVMSEYATLRADFRGIHQVDHDATDFMSTVGVNIMFGGTKKPVDSDQDRIPNSQDNCPNTPLGTPVDAMGCELDTDADGIVNAKDKCPKTPANVNVNNQGCAIDTDGDGVADYADKCASTPKGAIVNDNGCRKVLTEKVSIKLNVNFDSGKSDVKPEFFGQIAKVAKFMREYPDTTVVVEGHTDSSGAAWFNTRLSQRRAIAIADNLVDQYNISRDRVKTIGYGSTKPIADNRTEVGRKLNRRVVAQISTKVKKPM